MKLSSRTATRIGIVLAASTLLLTALRTVAYLAAFDPAVGYFRSATVSTLLYILPLLLSIVGICLAYLRSPALPREKKKKKTPAQKRAEREAIKAEKERIKALKRAGVSVPHAPEPTLDPPTPKERSVIGLVADLICAILFVIVTVLDFSSAAVTGDTGFQLRAILALLAAVSFVIPLRGSKLSWLAILLQLTTIAWCVACVAMDYFDWDVALNSPLKTYGQFSLCFGALYLTAHARAAASDLFIRRRNIFALPAAIFGISCGISGLCAYGSGIFLSPALSTLLISLALGSHALISILPMLRGDIPRYLTPAPQPLPAPSGEPADTESTPDAEAVEPVEQAESTDPSRS